MDTQIIKGNINELKGQIKRTWGKLTDDDISQLQGSGEEIIGKVQKAYGYSKDKAEEEFEKFKKENPNLFYKNDESSPYHNEEPVQQYISKARNLGSRLTERGTEIVKENPGYTILGALAVGFLAGAYFTRRRDTHLNY